jgi:type I restriction enzyme, S subunit
VLTHRASTIIGEIPAEWDKALLKSLLSRQSGGDWGSDDGEVVVRVLRSTNFTNRGVLDFGDVAVRHFAQAKSDSFSLIRDDLLLERSGGGPTQPVGRIGVIPEDLTGYWFSNFVQLLRSNPSKINPKFLLWLLLRLHQSGIIERLQHQTTQMRNLDFRDYLRVYLPVPSPPEQDVISKLLQLATAGLQLADAKMLSARRLKSALMQHLFTSGLPGQHTRFKKTKIGEIPEDWDAVSIGSVLSEPPFSGVSPQSHPDPPGTPILNVECIDDGLCTTEYISYVDIDEKTLEECRARQGDFYVLRGNGNREYVATGGLLREEPRTPTIFSDKLIRLRFKDSEVAERFIPYLWQSHSFLRRLQSKSESGSGLWMMSKRDIRRELFAKPPVPEQREIVALIETSISTIAGCHAEALALERLRRSLLQMLLTGNVRVRVNDVNRSDTQTVDQACYTG